MADQISNYKCPACGGPLHFEGASGRLECDYCESSFSVAEIEKLYEEKDEQAAEAFAEAQSAAESGANEWELSADDDWGADGAQMRAYNCPSCGAELICDATTAASSCPYCGNPTIVPGQFSGILKPDYVLPFKLDKEAAKKALREHYRGKKLLPKKFSDENHLEEIKGIYVPFWLFDGEADADLTFDATKTFVTQTHSERITTTKHYRLYRAGTVSFSKIPTDASSKMPDPLMDALEPFDYAGMKPFSAAYLPGFMADKYDVSVEANAERADRRAAQTAADIMRSRCLGYETVTQSGGGVNLRRGKVHYALLPVWVLNTKWSGKNFMFAMNGQTGKFVGDLPTDKGRYWMFFFITAAIVTAAATLALSFLLT